MGGLTIRDQQGVVSHLHRLPKCAVTLVDGIVAKRDFKVLVDELGRRWVEFGGGYRNVEQSVVSIEELKAAPLACNW